MEVLDGIIWAASYFYTYFLQSDVIRFILMLALIVFVFNIIVEVFNDNYK